jgi:hypothetical protein
LQRNISGYITISIVGVEKMLKKNINVSINMPILMLLSIVLLVMAARGVTYYVAPDGSNLNTGSLERPWATPAYGADQLQPGDTLII